MLRKKERKMNAENFYIDDCLWATTKLKSHQRKISVSSALKKKTNNQIRILTVSPLFEK